MGELTSAVYAPLPPPNRKRLDGFIARYPPRTGKMPEFLQVLTGRAVALDPRHAFELFNERMVRCRLAAQHALIALDDTMLVRRHFVHQFSHQPRFADPCIPFNAHHLSVTLTR